MKFSPSGNGFALAADIVVKDVSFPLGLVADVVLTFDVICVPFYECTYPQVEKMKNRCECYHTLEGSASAASKAIFGRPFSFCNRPRGTGLGAAATSSTPSSSTPLPSSSTA